MNLKKRYPISKNKPNDKTLEVFRENDKNGKKDLEKIDSNSPFWGLGGFCCFSQFGKKTFQVSSFLI